MIDVKGQISSVQRTVGSRALDAGEARVATITQIYDTTIDDLWDACTSADRIPRWFLPISGDLRLGGKYQFQGNAGGTIQSCDKPSGFTATWEYGEEVSWIDVRLSSTPDGRALFTLEHTAHVDDERWSQYGPGAVGVGWDSALLGLAGHLSSGESVDPADAMTWMASAEGREFITLSSESWCAASIVAGADPASAKAAAARTTAAYTGAPEPVE